MNRKKKLRIVQLSLLIFGILVIFFTYQNKEKDNDKILSIETKQKILDRNPTKKNVGNIFYNVEYSGLDLAGNRYVLKSKEASNDQNNDIIVNMLYVEGNFYFKDGKILNIFSDKGIYNNKTLDMVFVDNVKAFYEGSELYAQKAEYSNSESYLSITDDVKVKDIKGTINADKLFFDIKKQTLDIASFDNNNINANLDIK